MTHDLDPNHIIDEDYPSNRFERMDQICAQRLNSPDFGQPVQNVKRKAIGFLLVLTGLVILYGVVGTHLG